MTKNKKIEERIEERIKERIEEDEEIDLSKEKLENIWAYATSEAGALVFNGIYDLAKTLVNGCNKFNPKPNIYIGRKVSKKKGTMVRLEDVFVINPINIIKLYENTGEERSIINLAGLYVDLIRVNPIELPNYNMKYLKSKRLLKTNITSEMNLEQVTETLN